jgi:hypothetical protein
MAGELFLAHTDEKTPTNESPLFSPDSNGQFYSSPYHRHDGVERRFFRGGVLRREVVNVNRVRDGHRATANHPHQRGLAAPVAANQTVPTGRKR